ncbi:hypothetical protein [Bacillus infantis]|uniref:hypothetical protein n=1 Tax=Bacillus infantis TaxID=324767 RepID=UPI0020A14BDE|nr:hypothetical protein [Bacillus infantis]MCP1156574.1 hypothetical protein [Bacillus infantis]
MNSKMLLRENKNNVRVGKEVSKIFLLDRERNPLVLFVPQMENENIKSQIKRLGRYFMEKESVKIAILSDMVDMYFFSDFETPGVMDEAPFYKIHLPSFTQQDVDFLEQFQRDYFLDHFQELYAKWKEQYVF